MYGFHPVGPSAPFTSPHSSFVFLFPPYLGLYILILSRGLQRTNDQQQGRKGGTSKTSREDGRTGYQLLNV